MCLVFAPLGLSNDPFDSLSLGCYNHQQPQILNKWYCKGDCSPILWDNESFLPWFQLDYKALALFSVFILSLYLPWVSLVFCNMFAWMEGWADVNFHIVKPSGKEQLIYIHDKYVSSIDSPWKPVVHVHSMGHFCLHLNA